MTFPTIPTTGASTLLVSSQSTATTTHTFPNLSTLPNTAGALLLAVIVTYGGTSTNAEFSGWGGGMTEFVDQASADANISAIGAAYKLNATGSETGTFTVTTVTSTRSVMFLMEVVGAHTSEVPVATAKANGTSTAANPAALNPAGWDVEDTLWVAVAVNGEISLTGSFTGITAAPASYTGYADSGIIGGDVIGALEGAVAFRQNAVASEDVGAFTLDVGAAGSSALLIAVRPVPGAGLPFLDHFTGANSDPWDSAKWTTATVAGGVIDIQTNRGHQLSPTGVWSTTEGVAKFSAATDTDVLVKLRFNSGTVNYGVNIYLRADTPFPVQNGYFASLTQTAQYLYKIVTGTQTFLDSFGTTSFSVDTDYWVRLRMIGTTLQGKVWADGSAEPSTWGNTLTGQTDVASGVARLRAETNGLTTDLTDVSYDSILVTDPTAGLPPPPLVAPGPAVVRAATY